MNLFMLCAPYQMLAALELAHQAGMEDNHLHIMDTGHFTRAQFESVIDHQRWRSVQFHDFRYRLVHRDFGAQPPRGPWERLQEIYLSLDRWRKRRRADRIAASAGSPENLVLGNYRRCYDEHMRHIANRLTFKRLYLLDVGTDTLRVNADRQLDWLDCQASGQATPPASPTRARLRQRLVHWDTRGAPSVTFFTTYDIKPAPGDSVIRNTFAHLKSALAGGSSNRVLFAGQPILDQGYVDRDTFTSLLSRVMRHFAGRPVVYVVHPRESPVQLDIVKALGFEIERHVAPLEYVVSFGGERPGCIASFFSSVLENSAAIFGGSIALKAFRIQPEQLMKDRVSVADVYAHFETSGGTIEVVRDY